MRIAIVGAGISGLVAGYRLSPDHDVTLFEARDRIGGHTNTVECEVHGQSFKVDTGFIVYNDRTYPHFVRLLEELNVASQSTQMSFSVKCEQSGLEYNGTNLNGLFAQRRNLLNPKFWQILHDFRRFGKLARNVLEMEDDLETVGSFLQRHQFSQPFIRHYFLPMGAAIWSASFDKFNLFPIRFIAEFYRNHGLLNVTDRPQWRVIQGGSNRYLTPLTVSWSDRICVKQPVSNVRREDKNVWLTIADESPIAFDHVIFACHADQALKILGVNASPAEREVLAAFPYQSNLATLHTDTSVLPQTRRAWACWNYFCPSDTPDRATVTYNMNMLQSLTAPATFCVTLNDDGRIDPTKIISTFKYDHPTFSANRQTMQSRHHELINHNRISFCGAYWRNGFHEDGVVSALRVVDQLRNKMEEPTEKIATFGARQFEQ